MKKATAALYLMTLFSMLFFSTTPCASEEIATKELIELESRPGVIQRFILMAPEKPSAAVILIGGGPGKYGMGAFLGNPTVKNDGNFLVRTRDLFAEGGLAVAVLDACSDREGTKEGLTTEWRIGAEHLKDIETVASFMKTRYDLPVWIAGTSRGTFSTVNAAIDLGHVINGIVLTSAITNRPKADDLKRGILDMNLGQVAMPALVVAHKADKCFFSPPEAANAIKADLVKSSNAAVQFVSGGKSPKTDACKPLSAHGFYGVEKETVRHMCDFIKSN